MTPLQFPKNWALLKSLPNPKRTIFQSLREFFVDTPESRKRKEVCRDIHNNILSQIESRSTKNADIWSGDELEIVKCLEDAIATEKWISHCSIHPDDPLILLCWGEDDLTYLEFILNVARRTPYRISDKRFNNWMEEETIVKDVLVDILTKKPPN